MGRLCPRLLKFAANPLELSMLVPEFSTGGEVRCTGGGDVDDAEINAENCPVLVVILHRNLLRRFVLSETEMQIVLPVTLRERGFCHLPVVVFEVGVLVTSSSP